MHEYTPQQRSRMALKLASMKDGDTFCLNKNEPAEMLVVRFKRRKNFCAVVAVESGMTVASDSTETGLVGKIIKALQNWDIVLKQHFIDVARKNGMEP